MVGHLGIGAGRTPRRDLAADTKYQVVFGLLHGFQHQLFWHRQGTPHNLNRLSHKFTIPTLSSCTESAEEPI